jgi:hypothetical protein
VPYSRDDLINGLKYLITYFTPAQINLLDPTLLVNSLSFPDDHSDHVASALFGLTAAQRYVPTGTNPVPVIRMYRTYNIINEAKNVDAATANNRWSILTNQYIPHDKKICNTGTFTMCNTAPTNKFSGTQVDCDSQFLYQFAEFEDRQYPYTFTDDMVGLIKTPGGCMSGSGTTVSVAACSAGAAAQTWEVRKNGTIYHTATGLCLNATATTGSVLNLATCTTATNPQNQRFGITTGPRKDNGWEVSQMRGPDATCVTRVGTSYQIQQCPLGGNADQLGYIVQHPSVPVTVNNTNFNGSDLNTAKNYRTLVFGDLNADGKDDVCMRRNVTGQPAGVACALGNGAGSLTTSYTQTSLFGSTFDTVDTGGTLMIGDVNHDGKADLCARQTDGIYCAASTSTASSVSFGSVQLAVAAFANSSLFYSGYETSESRYGSIRLADVNGDGWLDVCGREGGIECAINKALTGSIGFNFPVQYTSDEFVDTGLIGWQSNGYGSTIQFGDIDGDNKVDVCGRGAEGIICELHKTSSEGFERSHLWTTDFSDYDSWDDHEYWYNSIRLVDINGDGKSDICGRDAAGLKCGLSQGSTFAKAQLMMVANQFDSASGYDMNQYGSRVGFARINAGTRPDACVRGPAGIKCSYGF